MADSFGKRILKILALGVLLMLSLGLGVVLTGPYAIAVQGVILGKYRDIMK